MSEGVMYNRSIISLMKTWWYGLKLTINLITLTLTDVKGLGAHNRQASETTSAVLRSIFECFVVHECLTEFTKETKDGSRDTYDWLRDINGPDYGEEKCQRKRGRNRDLKRRLGRLDDDMETEDTNKNLFLFISLHWWKKCDYEREKGSTRGVWNTGKDRVVENDPQV